ncbi:MAG: SurA N-terminal domain-containing protein [Prevotella sp.]|uniref:peptidylprolyl isomerase n=1 Tax=Prevotella sp. TaxID=59823 RepID=UPI002A351954|nr:SurA N-terminal domain-containing protein [Prevotella sp.]MDD7318854.1 SurA N-terminal domain-containing protein [Prevotellaceae bacterium]MDY4019231.1 SurA N-terminal domain-containing protein [Prevotella sp.]
MAAIGKIRSWGMVLIVVIGLGLFAFIAEDWSKIVDALFSRRNEVGTVLGKAVDINEFNESVNEFTEYVKIARGMENLTDEQTTALRDQVWQTMVQNSIIEKEAGELGLTVTDEELMNIMKEGTNPMLLQTPFVNQQTGRFDYTMVQKFLNDKSALSNPQLAEQYEAISKFWSFTEKNLRTQLLAQKYQSLFARCMMITNNISAKAAFTAENEESTIDLAAIPYSSINDNKVTVTDADLNAKYEELKPIFNQYQETRDIKFVSIKVVASDADRNSLTAQMKKFAEELQGAENPGNVVSRSSSLVPFNGVPVGKDAFPAAVASKLDSMSVGQTLGPVTGEDNTINVIRLIAKEQLPDSIQIRTIQVADAKADVASKRADSIYNAIQGGGDFEAIAKKYGQTGEKTWITTRQYQNASGVDADFRNYIKSINNMAVNETKNIQLASGNMIVQITDRRSVVTKYTAAVISKSISFSKDTYNAAYNKFSQYVSESQSIEALEKNAAKYGYKVEERKDLSSAEHYVANVSNTRDAMKWIYEAKEKEVSPLYECGNNDNLLVVALTGIHGKGYRTLDDANVKEYVKNAVIRDKKAEQIIANVKDVKSVEAAKSKGAQVSEVAQVTFAAPVFVQATGASEPALSGAVAATGKGKFSSKPVKGNAGVYLFVVKDKTNRPGKYDEATYASRIAQRAAQAAQQALQEYLIKADIKDNRYLFF